MKQDAPPFLILCLRLPFTAIEAFSEAAICKDAIGTAFFQKTSILEKTSDG